FIGEERVQNTIGHNPTGGNLRQQFIEMAQLILAHRFGRCLGQPVVGEVKAIMGLQGTQALVKNLLSLVNPQSTALEKTIDIVAGAAGMGGIEPNACWPWRARVMLQGHQVKVVQGCSRFSDLIVDVETLALVGQFGVDVIGEIDHRAAAMKAKQLTLRAKDIEY